MKSGKVVIRVDVDHISVPRMRLMLSIVALMLSTMVITAVLISSEEPEFVQIIGIDNYSKLAPAGGNATYNWTLRSVTSDNLTVTVQVGMVGEQWSYSVSPGTQNLTPNGLGAVKLTIFSPIETGSTKSNATVNFFVFEGSYLIQIETVHVVTSLSGVLASADKVLGLFDNPLPSPLNNEWGVFILDVVIWLLIALGVTYIFDVILKAFSRRSTTMIDDIILRIIRTPLIFIIFAYGGVQSLDALHEYIPEDVRATIWAIYQIALVLVIFYLAYKLFKGILVYYGKIIAKRTSSKIDDILVPVVEKIGVVIIGLAALGYVLNVMSVDLTMFVAGGVVISMVLAFAAQDTLSNFFSGMFILLDRPFTEGDTIILSDGDWCEVRKIGLRTTRLYRFVDATMISLPNNMLLNEKLIRYSNVSDPPTILVKVGVAYGTDVEKAKEVIRKAIDSSPYTLKGDPDRVAKIRFDQMADSSINFTIFCWINDRSSRLDAIDRLTTEIYNKLNEAGIEIPFPQRVVHMKKTD